MPRRTAPAVLSTLLCALALFGTTTQAWIHAAVTTSLQPVTVDVTGADAAPAVTALGLVAAVAAVLAVTADPRAAAQPAVGAQTGVISGGGEYAMTAWPWAAVAAAVLLGLCGIWLVLVAQRVRARATQRYDRAPLTGAAGPQDTAATGQDVTDEGSTSAAGPSSTPPGETQAAEHADNIDTWDALTRGEDPTRNT